MTTRINVPGEGVRKHRCGWWLGVGLALLPGWVGCTPPTRARAPAPKAAVLQVPLGTVGIIATSTVSWFSYLEKQAIDTVLEIRVHEHGLRGNPGSNPQLRLAAEVEAQLIRLQDGAELCRRRMVRQGAARQYTDWTEDDARALRSEIAACRQSLAQQIVEEMLPAPKDIVAGGNPQLKGGRYAISPSR